MRVSGSIFMCAANTFRSSSIRPAKARAARSKHGDPPPSVSLEARVYQRVLLPRQMRPGLSYGRYSRCMTRARDCCSRMAQYLIRSQAVTDSNLGPAD